MKNKTNNNDLLKMTTHDIQPSGWGVFTQSFSTEHAGWLATVGVSGSSVKEAIHGVEGRELPLRDIAIDLKDDQHVAVITIGQNDDNVLVHEVRNVSRISLMNIENDPSTLLQIDGANGQTTTLKVSPPLPDTRVL